SGRVVRRRAHVVPANAGTHSHRRQLLEKSRRPSGQANTRRGVWVPAFAGTTVVFGFGFQRADPVGWVELKEHRSTSARALRILAQPRSDTHPTNPPPLPPTHAPAAPASETSRTASAGSPAGSSASHPCAEARIRGSWRRR